MGVYDDDPVVAACRRDLARREDDARKLNEQEWDQQFREFLLDKYDSELLLICDRQLSPATRATYDGRLTRFVKWCEQNGWHVPLPASPEVVAMYLDAELEGGASYSALKIDHAAISYAHRIRNLPDPCPSQHPDADGEPFDPTWRPFPLAVLKRAYAQHKAKQEATSAKEK
jgi:hypothetical protein